MSESVSASMPAHPSRQADRRRPCAGPPALNTQYFPGYVACGLAYVAGLTLATAGLYTIGWLASTRLHNQLIQTVRSGRMPCGVRAHPASRAPRVSHRQWVSVHVLSDESWRLWSA